MTLFDAYLVVDWSARNTPTPARPTKDAIWVGEHVVARDHTPVFTPEAYFRTRHDCLNHLRVRLREHASSGRRVFLGFDFAYGYPAGFAEAYGLRGTLDPWRLVWDELDEKIRDSPNGSNNRFEVADQLNSRFGGADPGPFWGCPLASQTPQLKRTSPDFPYMTTSGNLLTAKRETERRLPRTQPTWKLDYPGNVGSQTLLGIPVVARLRDDPEFQHVSKVWPFETGFAIPVVPSGTPFILHAEIWPGVVNGRLDPALPIRDQAQVRAMVDWLAELDAENALLPLFDTPAGLAGDRLRLVLDQEGWIFGS